MSCPQCGEPIAAGDAFCENCGASLSTSATDRATSGGLTLPNVAQSEDAQSARTHLIAPMHAEPDELPLAVCASCGGEVGDDGWCTVCGVRASNGREHVAEQPSPTVVGVTDKGRSHPRNEDAFALAVDGRWAVLAVCDGVTTATDSDVASLAAAGAARDLLAAAPRPGGSPDDRRRHWSEQLKRAALAADKAAEATASDNDNPPSSTFVAAVADGAVIVAAWVGDSRAYWLPDDAPAEQLTVDDSWASEQIAAGVSREVAEADPKAHAITKWLGADSPEIDASTTSTVATTPGWLLVCSDGLWNYCSTADELGQLAAKQPAEPLARAEALVEWANEQGGHDNITVTLARITPEE